MLPAIELLPCVCVVRRNQLYEFGKRLVADRCMEASTSKLTRAVWLLLRGRVCV